jgi:hypothetical protein
MITTLTPIVVAIAVSLIFKSTRWIGIVGMAVMSYFLPIPVLTVGVFGGIAFCYYKYWWKKPRRIQP